MPPVVFVAGAAAGVVTAGPPGEPGVANGLVGPCAAAAAAAASAAVCAGAAAAGAAAPGVLKFRLLVTC